MPIEVSDIATLLLAIGGHYVADELTCVVGDTGCYHHPLLEACQVTIRLSCRNISMYQIHIYGPSAILLTMRQLPDWLTKQPIAHRGLHDKKLPENSIGAFKAAIKYGYAIELDVHLSRDHRLVVIHDDTTKRLTDKDLKVTTTFAADLVELRLNKTNSHIPLLDEVLAVVAGSVPLLVEVKTDSRANVIGPELQKILATYTGDFAIQSFDPRIINWFHIHEPRIIRGQLAYSFKDYPNLSKVQKFLLRTMLLNVQTRPDFIAYEISSLPHLAVSFWRKVYKMPLLTWTINTKAELQKARKLGANVIFEQLRV